MGFMGIGHWVDSDGAADFRATLLETIEKHSSARPAIQKTFVQRVIAKELKDFANEYNTPGFLNIALCLEVEGEDKGWDDPGLPVFSNLMTLAQLRKVSNLLEQTAEEGWKPKRMRELKGMVDNLIDQRKRK